MWTMARKATNWRIDQHLLDALRKIQDRDGVSVSEQVRRGIKLWLKRNGVDADALDQKRATKGPRASSRVHRLKGANEETIPK